MKLARTNYCPEFTIGANRYGIRNSGLSPVANGDDVASLMIGFNVPINRKRPDAADRVLKILQENVIKRTRRTWIFPRKAGGGDSNVRVSVFNKRRGGETNRLMCASS